MNLYDDHEAERKREHGRKIAEAERREFARTRWIKQNREIWIEAGCPDSIEALMQQQRTPAKPKELFD